MSSTHASNSQETKLFQSVHYKLLCMVCYTIPSIFLFSAIFQLKTILLCENLVIKALMNLMAHFIFFSPNKLEPLCLYFVNACTYMLELVEPCCHGERFQHCTCTLYSVDIMLFFLWMSPVQNKEGTWKSMEFVSCVKETPRPLS